MPAIQVSRRLVGAGLLAAALASGCATTTAPLVPNAIEEVASVPEPEASEFIPVVRYGRYTLVELAPTAAQRDLLLQTIDVSMPEDTRTTVGDGLRHVLKRSGYQPLRDGARAVIELYALPLPAAHLHLGPMTLRDALLTLAGPAWELHADDRARQICFEQPWRQCDYRTRITSRLLPRRCRRFRWMPLVSGGQP
jgi:conjugative transfer region protein (TIGR03748 family)